MSYKDRTFCSFYLDCTHGSTCPRSLTPEVKEGAQKWGGAFGAPISQFVDKPDCWSAIQTEDEARINTLTKAGSVFVEVKSARSKLQNALDKAENMTDSEYSEIYEKAKDLPNIVVIPE